MGESRFKLIVRVYAPFPVFGGGIFHGDNRGPTTDGCVTARIHVAVDFDPTAGTVGAVRYRSDRSTFAGTNIGRTSTPRVRVHGVKIVGGLFIQLDAAGAVPLLPLAPDIDVRVRMQDGGKDSGPVARLPGNRQLDMNALCASYALDAKGRFE